MKKEAFLKIVRSNMKADPTEQELTFFGSIGEAVEKAFQADSVTRKKEIDDLSKLLGSFDEGKNAAGVIRALAQKVDDMEKKSKRGLSNDEKFKLRSMLEDKKDDIKRAMQGGGSWNVEFKAKRAASAIHSTSTILTGATAHDTMNIFEDMDIAVFRYPENFIIDVIGGSHVSNVPAVWRWKEEITAGEGVPAKVAESGTKPLVDKKFEWKYAERNKFAGRVEFTEEVDIDFEQLVMDIVAMFERDVIIVWQDSVLADIITWTPTYTTSALDGKITTPTVYSCIGALKLRVQDQNYTPDVVFINPGDAAEAVYLQDLNGSQQFIPTELQFGGLRPIISNKVTQGELIVGDSSLPQEQHSIFILRNGVYGEQFINNERTVVGEVFSCLKLATEYKKGWVQGNIDTVKAALKKGV